MKTFKRRSLPDQIKYGGRVYKRDVAASSKYSLYKIKPQINFVVVEVLSKNLEGRTNFHNNPYQPTKWIFTINPYDVRNKS